MHLEPRLRLINQCRQAMQLAVIAARRGAPIALVLLVAAGPAAAADPVIATAASIQAAAAGTKVTLDLSGPVKFSIRALQSPNRLIVDMAAVDFRLPAGAGLTGQGLVKSFRYGEFGQGKSRLVIELLRPVKIVSAAALKSTGKAPWRLAIELAESDGNAVAADVEALAESALAEAGLAAIIAPKPRRAAARQAKPVIVLDAGHGGVDTGAVSPKGNREKDIVLAFTLELKKLLDAAGTYKVVLTRDADDFITLKGRVDFAQKVGASLFISIHADTVPGKAGQGARGLAVYTRSDQASDEEARLLALRENTADEAAGLSAPTEEVDIVNAYLDDWTRDESLALSKLMANSVLATVSKVTPLIIQPHRTAAFYVLRNPEVPAVLIELGFLSNPKNATELTSTDWRGKVAKSLAKSIDGFFESAQRPLSVFK